MINTNHKNLLNFVSFFVQIHQFSHNPHKEEQNWSVRDALAHYRGQVPGEEWLQEDAGQDLDELQAANNNLSQVEIH